MSNEKSVELTEVEREGLIDAIQDGTQDAFVALIKAAARREAETEVANAFVAWAAKNEIAKPPLDWAWFGEIARRYSPLHEEYNAEETP